ncbi:MAG: DUF58 domain-containing protein [Lentisphaeria bacterium]|nr:DUF58 domain-containing protein [Lentisphaeria bacterium]
MKNSVKIPGFASSRQVEELLRLLALRMQREAGSELSGLYTSRFRGRGLEFAELVEYQDGDDAAGIDWLASLRSGRIYRKRFQEDREIPVILACDCSASLYSQRQTLSALREATALFAACAVNSQDPIGLVFYSDHLERRLQPGRGLRQARRLLAELQEFQPSGQLTDLTGLFRSLNNAFRQHSRIFLFSDLHDTGYTADLARLCHNHEVLVCHLANPPLNTALPHGVWLEVCDAERDERGLLRRVEKGSVAGTDSIAGEMIAAGAEYLLLQTDQPVVSQILQFFRAGAGK